MGAANLSEWQQLEATKRVSSVQSVRVTLKVFSSTLIYFASMFSVVPLTFHEGCAPTLGENGLKRSIEQKLLGRHLWRVHSISNGAVILGMQYQVGQREHGFA